MIVHVFVVALMIVVAAAFLILWYYWVKKRISSVDFNAEQESVLVPFKYFCWVFLGIMLLTCLVQIHFMRVSATVHERLAEMAANLKDKQGAKEDAEEVKKLVLDLRKDMESGFARMLTWKLAQMAQAEPEETRVPGVPIRAVGSSKGKPMVAMSGPKNKPRIGTGFANEARAASASGPQKMAERLSRSASRKQSGKVYSMQLNLTGRVKATALSVRNQPNLQALIVERLVSGEQVKVTEKRLISDGLWYRVVTPLGRAGWVDHRHLTLELESAS